MSSPTVYFKVKPKTRAAQVVDQWIALGDKWSKEAKAFDAKYKIPETVKHRCGSTLVALHPPENLRLSPPPGFRFDRKSLDWAPDLKTPLGQLVRKDMLAVKCPTADDVAFLFFGKPANQLIIAGMSIIRGAGIHHNKDKSVWVLTTCAALTAEYAPIPGLVEITGTEYAAIVGKDG